jgi:hypothetical protein
MVGGRAAIVQRRPERAALDSRVGACAGWHELASGLRLSLSIATTIAAVSGIVAVLAVAALPAAIVARREGEPEATIA